MVKSAAITSYFSGNPTDVQRPLRGGLALMGGGEDQDEAFRFLVERGGGGDVLVLRASGSDGYNDWLMDVAHPNSVETLVFHAREGAFDPEVEKKIDQAEVVFLAGGDQSKYLRYWRDTPVQAALQRALLRGVPLGGTSAGLAVLGDSIFAAHQGGLDSQEVMSNPTDQRITLEPAFLGIPEMKGVLTDTHFAQRDRQGRLAGFLAQHHGQMRGLGVDEETALLVQPDGQGQVVGKHDVYWVTPQGPAEALAEGEPLTYRNLSVRVLGEGDRLNLVTGENEGGVARRWDVQQGEFSSSA